MSRIFSRAAAVALVASTLGGCASDPEFVSASRGALPDGGGYTLADAADAEVQRAVSARLAERGLAPSEQPLYLVQVSYAERPAGAGLFLPDPDEQAWLRAPDLRRKRQPVATLGISVAETASGQEVYNASASRRGGGRDEGEAWADLLDLVLPDPTAAEPASD